MLRIAPDDGYYGRSSRPTTVVQSLMIQFQQFGQKSHQWFLQQSPTKKIVLAIAACFAFIFLVIAMVFHKYIVGFLILLADKWQHLTYGKTILFILVFMVGFPPLLGFSPLSLLAGMIYGFPNGWPLLAVASVTGSFASFLFFRYILHKQAERMVQMNEKFRAFADVLKEDSSLIILILLRLCPLPYSLSNGALAAIPELPAWRYLLASIITSPKMLIHVFVGNKLRDLGSENKSKATKIVDVISMIIAGIASALTTYLIYSKMQAKIDYYHSQRNNGDYDEMIFGNLDTDSGNLELEATEFDIDNFEIEDEDDEMILDRESTTLNFESNQDQLPSLDSPTRTQTNGYRDN